MKSILRIRRFLCGAPVLLIGVIGWSGLSGGAYGQEAPAARRITMTECEGIDNCTTWTFLGSKGYGQWRTGEVANLSVESVKGDSIVISRTDVVGSKPGLTAIYNGTLRDNRVGGEFTSSWQGHSESGNWYWIVQPASAGPPSVMHWCAQHCSTWTLDKGVPFDKPHYGSEALGSIVIVDRFTRDSVLMHRTDYRPYPGTAVLRGQLSSDGNSIVNGTMEWTYHPCCGLTSGPFQAAWGSALNTVPGSDAERGGTGGLPPPRTITAGDVLQGAKDIRDAIELFQFFAALLQ